MATGATHSPMAPHNHGSSSITAATPGTSGSQAMTLDTTSSSPAYYDVIYIQLLDSSKSDTDTYTVAMSETEVVIVATEDTDTYAVGMDETESLFFLSVSIDSPTSGSTQP
jgi:hypothetical protein